jgi:hypothetical protein
MSTFLTCPGIDLIYERATVFERGLSLDCIRHQTPPSVFFLDATEQSETTIIFWTRALHDSAAYLDSRPSCLTCSASNAPNAPAKAATESAGSRETRPQANMTKWKEQLNGDCRSGRSRWLRARTQSTRRSNARPRRIGVKKNGDDGWRQEPDHDLRAEARRHIYRRVSESLTARRSRSACPLARPVCSSISQERMPYGLFVPDVP